MDKRDEALRLRNSGMEYLDIAETLKINLNFAYKLVSEARSRLRMGNNGDYSQVIMIKRAEIMQKEKRCKDLLPFKSPEDCKYFHKLEKEINQMNTDLNYFIKKQEKNFDFKNFVGQKIEIDL